MTQTRAAVLGAIVGTASFSAIGSRADMAPLGALGGSALGSVVGLGVAKGWVGSITLAAILGATFACLIGPGFDDYGGHAAPGFAAAAAGMVWTSRFLKRSAARQAETDRRLAERQSSSMGA